MDESSAKRSFPTGMVALLGLGLIGIGLWYVAALQPVAVKAIPPTALADPGEARTLGRMERFDLPGGGSARGGIGDAPASRCGALGGGDRPLRDGRPGGSAGRRRGDPPRGFEHPHVGDACR